ncbi:hypothetical protein GQ457_07G005570 [Hibiscus cannabinus]
MKNEAVKPDWSIVKDSWIWNNIRDSKPKVHWHKLLWFPLHIPKHSIIAWMAVLDRLPSKDRLSCMGITTDTSCKLCDNRQESRSYLFFSFPFSASVWSWVFKLAYCKNKSRNGKRNLLGP